MLKNNSNTNESDLDNENLNDIKEEKKFMNLYPIILEDVSPKHPHHYQSKNTNFSKEKRKFQNLTTKNGREEEDIYDSDGTYKINDSFLELIVKERCPLSKKKVHQTIGKIIKNSDLLEKIKKESKEDNNPESPENLCVIVAQNMSYTEYKNNKFIYKVGDKGDKLYFIIRGQVNIFKPVQIKAKMTFQDYLSYCLLLNKYKEEYLLNKILMSYFKTIPLMFIEEIKKTFIILFKLKLVQNIQNKKIENNKQLKSHFEENDVDFDDLNIDFRELEKIEANKENQEWESYIVKRCTLSYGELSYFEKFDHFIKKNIKLDIDCYIFEYVGKAKKGQFFGDLPLEKDGNFLKKKREFSVCTVEDTVIASIKNEDFMFLIAPNIKLERNKNINFINNNYFFKPINNFVFSRNYFQYFIRHEITRGNILFENNSIPKSLILIQEGNISLSIQCSLIQLNNLIEKLYVKLVSNKYYSEALSKKLMTKQMVNNIKNYINDYILKNIKLQNLKIVEEINKIRNFQVSLVSKEELVGLEEIFFDFPYIMKGEVSSEKIIFYELSVDNLDNIVHMEPLVEELYIKGSINKLLSLIERLQNLKKNIIDLLIRRYDNFVEEKNNNKIKSDNYNNNKEININEDIKDNNNKFKNNINNEEKKETIDNSKNEEEIKVYTKINNKLSKRDFSSIRKQRINYYVLENMKKEEKEDINDINNSHISVSVEKRKSLKNARSAKKLTTKIIKNLFIEPTEEEKRVGSVDIIRYKNRNKNKKENEPKDAIFIIDRYYTLDGIKNNIERNKKRIKMINKLYNKNIKSNNKKENLISFHDILNDKIKEEESYNNHKTINIDSDINNNFYKNVNLRLNIPNNSQKFKTINEDRQTKKISHKNLKILNINFVKQTKIKSIDINKNKNELIISKNYLYSNLQSRLPKLNLETINNKLNENLNNRDCSSGAVIDKMIYSTKKTIIPKIVKHFYENKKMKGLVPYIYKKESNTLFLRKYNKKYKNIISIEGNVRSLPKIYKQAPLNKSLNPNI